MNGSVGMWGSIGGATELWFWAVGYNTKGKTLQGAVPITYNNGTPLITTQTILVQINAAGVNRFTNNTYGCIAGPGGNRGSLTNVGGCFQTTPTFAITVIVQPPPDVCLNIPGNQATVPAGYTQ